MDNDDWSTLGAVHPCELFDTRLAVHYAAQPLAAAAVTLLPTEPDYSHTNLLWMPDQRRFLGRPLPGGHRGFLDVVEFRIGVLDRDGTEVAVVAPSGRTLDQLFAWMTEALRAAGEAVPDDGLSMPNYELPAAPVARGESFTTPEGGTRDELKRWFHDGYLALSEIANRELGGAEVRTWPHHFDMAALLVLDPGRDPEQARSVGAGFSPGDERYPEPYFYVSPWPYPDAANLPSLTDGACWHTEEFTAAVLTGSEVVSTGDGAAQLERVREFLSSAVAHSRSLLGS